MENNFDNLDVFEDSCFERYLVLIHSMTGITIAKNRKSMVQGRIRKRIGSLSLKTYEDYYNFVMKNESEKKPFIDLVTTNETYFFRTPRIWSYLENQYLADWIKNKEGRKFLAWSAASSTGEEAHSLGVLCQAARDKSPKFDYEISASDISQRVLQVSKDGNYQGRSIESFRNTMPQVFAKYMIKSDDDHYTVQPEIKKRMKFFEHNLFTILKNNTTYDLILIRNVFIYFTIEDQKKVLDLILPKLASDGILIIGESESLTAIGVGLIKVENLIYKKEIV